MIFEGGIQGVGKSFFCDAVKNKFGLNSYSASQLIVDKKNKIFSKDKLVQDIYDNQRLLVATVEELRKTEREFILDGHFCLLNAEGVITRVSLDTYISLQPNRIITLLEKPEVIVERRFRRDGILHNMSEIEKFQNEEKLYAEEIARQLGVPIIVSAGANDIERVIEWIKIGGYWYGRTFFIKKVFRHRFRWWFFDSLKKDYPGTASSTGFVDWFNKKSKNGSTALVFEDEIGVGAFVALKQEDEEIVLQSGILPAKKRIKISTFWISKRYRRQRIG